MDDVVDKLYKLHDMEIMVILKALARFHDNVCSETFDKVAVDKLMKNLERQSGIKWTSLGGRN